MTDPVLLAYGTKDWIPIPLPVTGGIKLIQPRLKVSFVAAYSIFDTIPGSDCSVLGYKIGSLVKMFMSKAIKPPEEESKKV